MSLAVFVKRPQALQISASKGNYSSFAPARQAVGRCETIADALHESQRQLAINF
ncbi:hypothetical protein [Vandammella animalimorsus]|uniref:hypothetical protein n=1 Tax=Vandammella animalimorsus TaxID=2029117 RepID=UPI0015562F20|nr:hypothetical protein [Vandammella animalimorsus]